MYDDLKEPGAVDVVSQKSRLQEQLLKIMDKTLENNEELSSDDISNMFNGAYDAIRHINDWKKGAKAPFFVDKHLRQV